MDLKPVYYIFTSTLLQKDNKYKLTISIPSLFDNKDIIGTDFEIIEYVIIILLDSGIVFNEETKKIFDSIELCECCQKSFVRYKLFLQNEIRCRFCQYLKYKKNGLKLFLCKTNCKSLYWTPDTYLTERGEKNSKITYCLEKDECNKCGKCDYQGGLFAGEYIV